MQEMLFLVCLSAVKKMLLKIILKYIIQIKTGGFFDVAPKIGERKRCDAKRR